MALPSEKVYLNGIDGGTGQPLIPPLWPDEAIRLASSPPRVRATVRTLRGLAQVLERPSYGLPFDIDPSDVATAGWGVVFPAESSVEVRKALQPLLDHRQAHVMPERFRLLDYRRDETHREWRMRHGVAVGSVVTERVPYYLLLAGPPSEMPFEFQSLLAVEYAVGRLHFDRLDDYRRYAESVVAYEAGSGAPAQPEGIYWSPTHTDDVLSTRLVDLLVAPLYERKEGQAASVRARWFRDPEAVKQRLVEVLHDGPPGPQARLLFAAAHGLGWPRGHPLQLPTQGALVCQDWPGDRPLIGADYLSAEDIGDEAHVHGLVAFLAASYAAGSPSRDQFLKGRDSFGGGTGETDFVAALPQRLLAHPHGGALAVIGPADRAWACAVAPRSPDALLGPYRSCVRRILTGQPVGLATKDFSERYAGLSAELLALQDDARFGRQDENLVSTWVERNACMSYVVLGDPAVRLRVRAVG